MKFLLLYFRRPFDEENGVKKQFKDGTKIIKTRGMGYKRRFTY